MIAMSRQANLVGVFAARPDPEEVDAASIAPSTQVEFATASKTA